MKNQTRVLILALAFATVLLACTVPSFLATFKLSGRIVDADGKALANQTVPVCAEARIAPACGGDENYTQDFCDSVQTDADGNFQKSIAVSGGADGHCYSDTGIVKIKFFVKQGTQKYYGTVTGPDTRSDRLCFNTHGSASGTNQLICEYERQVNFILDQRSLTAPAVTEFRIHSGR